MASEHLEHVFFKLGDCKLVAKEDLSGPKYTFLTDGSEDSYVITWEAYQSNYATLMIDTIADGADGASYDIKATNIRTKESVQFNVLYENVNSTTELFAGDVITYSDDNVEGDTTTDAPATAAAVAPTVYVRKSASKTLTVKYDELERTFTDLATGKVYYTNQSFLGNKGVGASMADGDVATVTLALDMANTVVYYK